MSKLTHLYQNCTQWIRDLKSCYCRSRSKVAVKNGIEKTNPSSEAMTNASKPKFDLNTLARREFRLLGYYNFPNQRMNPEEDFPNEAEEICKLLALSFRNISTSPDIYAPIKETFATAVFIFKDRGIIYLPTFPKRIS